MPSSVHSRFFFKSCLWASWVHKGNKVWLQNYKTVFLYSAIFLSFQMPRHQKAGQSSIPEEWKQYYQDQLSGPRWGDVRQHAYQGGAQLPYGGNAIHHTAPRGGWDQGPREARSSSGFNVRSDSEYIFVSIATQARGGNHTGRHPSQTTASHKAGLGSRDAATRNPMGLRGSKATRQPNITGTTGRGSRNQTP